MGQGHVHRLYVPGNSPVHRLPPQCKLVALLAFVLVVVATPRERIWAFALYAALLAAVAGVARVRYGLVLRRTMIEVPFVVFALLLPFFATGEKVTVLGGLELSGPGLWGAWNILAKGTLGVLVSLTLAGTTPLRDLVVGLQRLRAPALVVTIVTLMLRYLEVIAGEARRMRLARISRGHDPRFLHQVGATARGVGSLFIRSYERGERVHLAMLSRGYTGSLPGFTQPVATRADWLAAGALPLVALLTVAAAWTGVV